MGALLLGEPNQQRAEDMETISYEKAIPHMLDLKADVVTFEMSSTGGRDLKFFKDYPTKKKIGIGVIDHVSCQVESPKQVAKLIRQAIKYIDPGQLVITSDCGFGREGFGRRIAYYKLRSMVEGPDSKRRARGKGVGGRTGIRRPSWPSSAQLR